MRPLKVALCIKDDAKRKEPSVQKMTNAGVRRDLRGGRRRVIMFSLKTLTPRLASYMLCNAATQEKCYVNVIMFSNLYRLNYIHTDKNGDM
jgi:hypothetical protein